jgi:hypothetical protein
MCFFFQNRFPEKSRISARVKHRMEQTRRSIFINLVFCIPGMPFFFFIEDRPVKNQGKKYPTSVSLKSSKGGE